VKNGWQKLIGKADDIYLAGTLDTGYPIWQLAKLLFQDPESRDV